MGINIVENYLKHKNIAKIECLFLDNKAFIFIGNKKRKIIKIGEYNENDLFKTEIIINTTIPENIYIIQDLTKINGYDYIVNLSKNCKTFNVDKNNNISLVKFETLLDKENIFVNNNKAQLEYCYNNTLHNQDNNNSNTNIQNKKISPKLETLLLIYTLNLIFFL